MKLAYQAFDRAGKAVSGTLEAGGSAEASEQLRRQGLFVTSLVEAAGGLPRPQGARSAGGRARDVAIFARQMSILIATRTPVVQALEALERQTSPGRWRDTLADVRRRVEEGATLADAMHAHPTAFDNVARSLIAAGESGGRLDVMLDRLAALTQRRLQVRRTVVGAMVYPAVLIAVSVIVLAVMFGFVLPRFEGLFEMLDAPLPPTTKITMAISRFVTGYWYLVLAAAALAVGGARWYLRSAGGRRAVDVALVRTPRFGAATRNFATARIARILGVLVEGRVAVLEAIELTRAATSNSLYADLLLRAEEAVARGESLSDAFRDPSLVPPSVTEAIVSAERTGQLGPVLTQIADFMDEDNEVLVKSLTGLLEPLILIGLGVAVGLVAVSMFLPLFDLAGSGGGPA